MEAVLACLFTEWLAMGLTASVVYEWPTSTTLDKKKKKNHSRDSWREERFSTCVIMLDHARSAQDKSRGSGYWTLPFRCSFVIKHYHKIEQRSSRRESWVCTWFFFFVQGSTYVGQGVLELSPRPMGHIHLRGKWRPRTPRWYNAALTHTKWMGNLSSPTLNSNCENRRACFCQTSPGMHVWGILVPIRTIFKRSNRPRG